MFFLYPRRRSLRQLAFLPAAALALSAPGLLHGQVTYTGTSPALSFGSVNYCPAGQSAPAPCSSTLTLTYSVAANTTIGSVGILTTGATNLDFQAEANDASSTLCAARTYAAPTTCTVDVTFAPLAPGLRKGAVQIVDGGGNILANTYIYGSGVAPVIAFPEYQVPPPPPATIPLSDGVGGIAIDAGGNLYVTGSGDLKEILAVDGRIPANPTIKTLVTGLVGVQTYYDNGLIQAGTLAIDGAGNLFVDAILSGGALTLEELVAVNGSIPANPTIRTLYSSPHLTPSIAVDAAGDVYITEDGSSYAVADVKEILAVNGTIPANPTIKTLVTGLTQCIQPCFVTHPEGVAVDATGDIFVDDNGYTKELVAVNGTIPANPTVKLVAYSGGSSMAVDAAGDVFFPFFGGLSEIPATDGTYTFGASMSFGEYGGGGPIAIDPNGNAFVLDFQNLDQIYEYSLTTPPSFAFDNTIVGQTSTDSPGIVQIQNIGTGRLTGSAALSDTADFKLGSVHEGTTDPACPAEFSLGHGSLCMQGVDFTPQSIDRFNATITLADNALNVASATQTIAASGTGTSDAPVAQAALGMPFGLVQFGTYQTLALFVQNIGGGTLTVSPSINGPSYFIQSSNCGAGVAAGQYCTLQVEFKPVAIGYHADTLTILTNGSLNPNTNQVNPVVSLTGTATGVGVEMETPLQFGTIAVGTTEVLPLTIRNIGVYPSAMVGASVNGPSYKVLTTAQNTCLAGVTQGHTCVLPIEFDPVAVGTHDDILTLTPNLGAAASTVHLDGTAD
jgi:hypothetical protein